MTPAVDDRLELVIGMYQAEETSRWVLKTLERLQRERALFLVSTAILIQTYTGQLITRQVVDWSINESGLIDGLTAAIVSLFKPYGHLGTLAFNSGGLSVEVLLEHLDEIGIQQEALKNFSEHLSPSSSILLAITHRPWASCLLKEMSHFNAYTIHEAISSSRDNLGNDFIALSQAVTLEQSQCAGDLSIQARRVSAEILPKTLGN